MVKVGAKITFSYGTKLTFGIVKAIFNNRILVKVQQDVSKLYGTGTYKCLISQKEKQCKKELTLWKKDFKDEYCFKKSGEDDFYDWLEENCSEHLKGQYEPRYNRVRFPQCDDYGSFEFNFWLDDIAKLCEGKTYLQIQNEIMKGEGDGKLREFIMKHCPGSWWEFYDKIWCYKKTNY